MEEARESYKLLIISGVMGVASYIGWRQKQPRNNAGITAEVPQK